MRAFHLTRSCSVVPLLFLLSFSSADSQFLSTRIRLDDWGLSSVQDVRLGQVAIIHEDQGDQLVVYTLRDQPSAPAPSVIQSEAPTLKGDVFLVSDFGSGGRNALGGSFNAFSRTPSSASVGFDFDPEGRRSLKLSYTREKEGFCGLWIHLFNSTDPPEWRKYLDARSFSVLCFWIRGHDGNEKLLLKIADAELERKEDAVTVADVGSILPSGAIDTTWQCASLSLANLPKHIIKSQLATISLEGVSPVHDSSIHDPVGSRETRRASVELKDLAFGVKPFSRPTLSPPFKRPRLGRQHENAIWVWNTGEILGDSLKEARLADFATRNNFRHIFLALPYHGDQAMKSKGMEIEGGKFRRMLSQLHRRGLKVHALLGDKEFVKPRVRPFVTATLENIVRYNESSKPDERFDGIHLDVEPYLNPGFGGPMKGVILKSFLDLLGEAASIARRANVTVGCDVPFWFDNADEFTHEAPLVEFRGKTKPVYQHIIDLMDMIAVMSYRTSAAGVDGVVIHVSDEMAYAAETGKYVFVGLETGAVPNENILTFEGTPSTGMATIADDRLQVFLVPQNDSASVYVIPASKLSAFKDKQESFGLRRMVHWPARRNSFIPGDKLTFASLGRDRLRRVMEETSSELSGTSSYIGFAIHHYESYTKLLESSVH